MTDTTTPTSTDETPVDPVARVLERANAHSGVRVFGQAQALQDESTITRTDTDGEQWDREERAALRRVPGLSTELEDVTEVEYRQLRLENVILVGVHPQGELEDAENSLRELAALAETAGAVGAVGERPTAADGSRRHAGSE